MPEATSKERVEEKVGKKKTKDKIQEKKIEKPKTKEIKQDGAKLNVRNLSISTKHAVEICRFIRNKSLTKAKALLLTVINKKSAVPYRKHNKKVAHKPGMASGKYPVKASNQILKLLNSVEANAEDLGLDTKSLVISEIKANKGAQQFHFGRKRRRRMKRTNLQIVVREK